MNLLVSLQKTRYALIFSVQRWPSIHLLAMGLVIPWQYAGKDLIQMRLDR
mgnify:FL=1